MNPEKENGLLTLWSAIQHVQGQDVKTKLPETSVEKSQTQTDTKIVSQYEQAHKTFLEGLIDMDSIPNHLVTGYFENISDELSRKYRFRCRFSPTCPEVITCYGNELKGTYGMKSHLVYHHFSSDSFAHIKKKIEENKSRSGREKLFKLAMTRRGWTDLATEDVPKSPKKINAIKNDKFVPQLGPKRIKSVLQQEVREEAENAHVASDTKFEENDSTDLSSDVNIIRRGQCEHDYAKNHYAGQLFNAKSVKETRQKKQRKTNIVSDKEIINLVDNVSESRRPVIRTPLFPFVYTPCPLEPAQVVEFNSNGDPINYMEPVFVQPSTSKIFFKKPIENKVGRKKMKISGTACTHRSVLECVENRVACKSNFLPEQRNALLPDDSIENSENVEKSVQDIAWRNIEVLSEQKGKRKYRDKPSVYICEICERHFTANTSLTYHYLGHLNIKPFKCHICYRAFTRRHSLKYHMMIHANKNRFQCPTCKRLFRHPSHYKEHLRKHTGEEPFSCKFCSNKFKTRNSFKRHLKMQHQKLLTSNGIVPIRNDA